MDKNDFGSNPKMSVPDNDLVGRPISEIVNTNLLFCTPEETISDAARSMQESGCSSIIVMEQGIPVGIWTERDSLSVDCVNISALDRPIRQFMRSPVKTINHKVSIGASAVRFKEEGVRHLLVVDDDSDTLGIITQTDVILRHGIEYYLGIKTVGAALTNALPLIDEKSPLAETITVIRRAPQSAVCVAFADGQYGIITDKDVTRLIANKQMPETAGDFATKPLVSISAQASLLEARNSLAEYGFRHIGVIDSKGLLIGLLSYSGILTSLQYEYFKQIDSVLSERELALKHFQSNLRLAHKIIEHSLDGVMLVNAAGIIEYVNPTFSKVTGFSAEEALGCKPSILKSGRHSGEFYAQMWDSLKETGHWQGEIWNRRKNGEVYPEWLTITAIRDDNENVQQYAGIFCDITEQKERDSAIRKMAFYDDLTGLPNRRLFRDRLKVALARARRHKEPLAVMFLDLDQFKKINDTLGHLVGDTMLIESAERIRECLREEDTVARLGGDEFVMLFHDVDNVDEIVHVAERMKNAFNKPFTIDGQQFYVTCSMGISLFPEDGEDADTLLKNADAAMYRSKEEGRNTYNLFSPVFTANGIRHLEMENALRQALHNGELRLALQPKISAKTGELLSLEALARWESPTLGSVSPVEFIPLAENVGLIGDLGVWAMNSACEILADWRKQGHPEVSIAVNVSPLQMSETSFPQAVAAVLKRHDVPARLLEIELTESSFLKEFDKVRSNLDELKALGTTLSIDDFGTGFSSLSYLTSLPLDYLKIDRSFVGKIFEENQSKELVSTILAMAKNLGLGAIAEGVETDEQATFLRDTGCNFLQGFLYSEAVSPEEIVKKYWR